MGVGIMHNSHDVNVKNNHDINLRDRRVAFSVLPDRPQVS